MTQRRIAVSQIAYPQLTSLSWCAGSRRARRVGVLARGSVLAGGQSIAEAVSQPSLSDHAPIWVELQ